MTPASRLLAHTSILALVLSGCAADVESPASTDVAALPEISVDPGDPEDDKGDHLDLAIRPLDFAVPSAVGRDETRRVITSARAFRDFFGVAAPRGFDFGREWVVFYSAGVRRTGGYDARVTGARLSRSGVILYVRTELESPGPDCHVTFGFTKPHAIVRITRPRPVPSYAAYVHVDHVRDCSEPSSCRTVTPTDLATLDLTVRDRVRAVLLAPTDRPFAECVHEQLDGYARIARTFFRDELARWGHVGAEGLGETFVPELGQDGSWNVVYMVGEHDTAWYQSQTNAAGEPDAPGAALAEMYRRLPDAFHRDNVVVYLYDTASIVDGRLVHSGNGGSAAPWEGERAGYVLQGTHFLGMGFSTIAVDASAQASLFEQTAAAGVTEIAPDGSWRALTRGEYASVYVGAAIHELGHAFGLEHIFTDYDGDGIETNLMGNGFRRFGGRFTPLGAQPPTELGPDHAAQLGARF